MTGAGLVTMATFQPCGSCRRERRFERAALREMERTDRREGPGKTG